MKRCCFILSLILMWFVTAVYADEQCPSITQVRRIFQLPNNAFMPRDPTTGAITGRMPYPVNISDPHKDEHSDEWFVVSGRFVSLRGNAPTPFITFVVFSDNTVTTNSEAIAKAKEIINDPLTVETSEDVDYPHFYMGDDPDGSGKKYYFDVCMYRGLFDKAIGTRDTDQEDMMNGTLPIVMVDLSPDQSVGTLSQFLLKRFAKTGDTK